MDNNFEKSVADEIADVKQMVPHLVILGAGASRAAFPSGEGSGKLLPLMNDFTDIVPVQSLLKRNGVNSTGLNFEEIYSNLSLEASKHDLCLELERTIYDYFSGLSLPRNPTIYDHLLLSLRGKDVIATFNWDPFLIQAYRRNIGKVESLPILLFLHGNVLTGYCRKDDVHGTNGGICSKCGKPYLPSQILFPIKNKDYNSDPDIASQWKYLNEVLKCAFYVTIFGYSAPTSDAAAIDILSHAWGKPKDRQFEQIEIIDLKDDKTLWRDWSRFIHTHHYRTHKSFYESWIANHPRRTCEASFDQNIGAKFIERHSIPKKASFPRLWDWFVPLNEAEKHVK